MLEMVSALSDKAATAASCLDMSSDEESLSSQWCRATVADADNLRVLEEDVTRYTVFWQEFGRAIKLGTHQCCNCV